MKFLLFCIIFLRCSKIRPSFSLVIAECTVLRFLHLNLSGNRFPVPRLTWFLAVPLVSHLFLFLLSTFSFLISDSPSVCLCPAHFCPVWSRRSPGFPHFFPWRSLCTKATIYCATVKRVSSVDIGLKNEWKREKEIVHCSVWYIPGLIACQKRKEKEMLRCSHTTESRLRKLGDNWKLSV